MKTNEFPQQSMDLLVVEVAGWRALLTTAQHRAHIFLPAGIEQYLVRLLYGTLGQPSANSVTDTVSFFERLAARSASSPTAATVGDQCLLFAGLFPEYAIRKGIPLAYLVQVGANAYREQGAQAPDPTTRSIVVAMADHFVPLLDVLHTLRELQQENSCIDPLNAHDLCIRFGSAHARHVLQRVTSGFPAAANFVRH
ncbi:MAG: hypothetical protein HYX63_06690 [Gammaproteobacteria bacterium]|nr:hypothetical protein [Gammaproteobacteria bacterium]